MPKILDHVNVQTHKTSTSFRKSLYCTCKSVVLEVWEYYLTSCVIAPDSPPSCDWRNDWCVSSLAREQVGQLTTMSSGMRTTSQQTKCRRWQTTFATRTAWLLCVMFCLLLFTLGSSKNCLIWKFYADFAVTHGARALFPSVCSSVLTETFSNFFLYLQTL